MDTQSSQHGRSGTVRASSFRLVETGRDVLRIGLRGTIEGDEEGDR